MKPSSGRARSAATLAATALCGFAVLLVPGTRAFAQAQKATPVVSGPAVRDGTPEIDAAIAQKNWNAALTQLDARIAANPRDAQAQFKRGTVLAHLNRDDEAISAFVALTQSYPELPEPYNNLAALYAKHGHYTEAREALETATKANPNYGLAYENLGDLYLRLAASAYQRAQTLGQASGTSQQRLADIQKIVSPPANATPVKKVAAPEEDYTRRATSNMTQTPSFNYGGPNGSLAMPPYMAPSQ
ncbi:tetratricopeptide repeat protein [Paraburkholderia sp. DHOC27]|uniref:tetratricopeptide repeat protein n=1 Tax=Paraburkholderia sp. DHOC27 TaxID=2303330 RepID=UPI000E3BB899|nr:tetratricopeptide repeat protein [Paraburkholderia sp. DHOC27]RFU45551.1 tetratricopeptide repeat protein [Paraburkholderia sp. DHOC27]